ncbi:MAG: choice-of-anchor L domain-containing protein, partial [Bacteroidia bacterium]|nr:choice-of-anchor L domain-containing protein [Bacteroidia bacterium]
MKEFPKQKHIQRVGTSLFILLAIGLLSLPGRALAQITVNTSFTPAQLVQNVFLGQGVSATNVTYNGAPVAIGFFNGANSNLGLNSGIILSTGDVNFAPGPNNQTGAGIDNNRPGDPQLNAISNGTTEDAAVLEFDFVPITDTIQFRYVFASEEYPEFAPPNYSNFNDVFAFFLSGPGIVGTPNIALLPGTSIPVTINNVNAITNNQYYIDNANGTTVEYDAFTTVLTAKAVVIPCSTYHIKIAVADVFDGVFDSAVFLEAGSFSSGNVAVSAQGVNVNNNTQADPYIVENCGDGAFIFSRDSIFANQTTVIRFTLSGTAINGVDYQHVPDSIVFLPGEVEKVVTVSAIPDALVEGNESIIIRTIQLNPCSGQPIVSDTLFIRDFAPLALTLPNDTLLCETNQIRIKAKVVG